MILFELSFNATLKLKISRQKFIIIKIQDSQMFGSKQKKILKLKNNKEFKQQQLEMEKMIRDIGYQYLREKYPNDTPQQYNARIINLKDQQLIYECFYLFTMNKRRLYYCDISKQCHRCVMNTRFNRMLVTALNTISYNITQYEWNWYKVQINFHWFKKEIQVYLYELYTEITKLVSGYQGKVQVQLNCGKGHHSDNGVVLIPVIKNWIQQYASCYITSQDMYNKGQLWGLRIFIYNQY